MKLKKLVDSFNHAINGVIDTARTERNMKIHLTAAVVVLIACCFFDIVICLLSAVFVLSES